MTGTQISILVGVLILLALVVWGGFLVVQKNMLTDDVFTAPTTTDTTSFQDALAGDTYVITHSFTNGTHRYGGTLTVPTPCHTLSGDATVAESFPEQIRLVLTTSAPASNTVCTQVLAQKQFNITARASAQALLVGVTLDGVSLPFELFEEAKG